jgi:hypothetical protein
LGLGGIAEDIVDGRSKGSVYSGKLSRGEKLVWSAKAIAKLLSSEKLKTGKGIKIRMSTQKLVKRKGGMKTGRTRERWLARKVAAKTYIIYILECHDIPS